VQQSLFILRFHLLYFIVDTLNEWRMRMRTPSLRLLHSLRLFHCAPVCCGETDSAGGTQSTRLVWRYRVKINRLRCCFQLHILLISFLLYTIVYGRTLLYTRRQSGGSGEIEAIEAKGEKERLAKEKPRGEEDKALLLVLSPRGRVNASNLGT